MSKIIVGSGGGGKSGGSGRAAREDPNTLRSAQDAEIIDLISEGEIEGLADGLKSVYFDQVPVMNKNESLNFSGFELEVRNGTQSQDPLKVALEGTRVTTPNPNGNTEIKFDNPQEVTISDTRVRKIDITMGVPTLTYQQPETGDLKGYKVEFRISIFSNLGATLREADLAIQGKCTSLYQQSFEFNIQDVSEDSFPLLVRVARTSPDSTTVNYTDRIYFYQYTIHIPTVLSYPNSALVGLRVDAEQFSQIPTRGYEIKGIKVRIPTNYDPLTRIYTGSWDGTFKVAWTDNPAWVYYDLVTEDRYGLGNFIDLSQLDKWGLYEIAKYCDELVPDGFGGLEPRFTCNIYIQNAAEAYKVLGDIASIFRAMQYWSTGQIFVTADMPRDPVAQFTNANVVDGVFSYAGSSVRSRHTVILVTWNDPADFYQQKIEYVEDSEGVKNHGIITTDLMAIGCTSRGQAHRIGKWLLYTERMETETVAFKCGIEYAAVAPGDVIQTVDSFRAGNRLGGRIKEAVSNSYTLDSPIDDGQYQFSFFSPTQTASGVKAELESRSGTVIDGVFYRSGSPFTVEPVANDIWVASKIDVQEPEYWRVISVSEEDDLTANIIALEYRNDKYDAVEEDVVLEARPVSTIVFDNPEPPYIPTDNETTWFQEYLYRIGPDSLGIGATFSWTSTAPLFVFRIQEGEDGMWREWESRTPSIDIKPIELGLHNIQITAVNTLGIRSQPLELQVVVLGKANPPQDVTGFKATRTPSGVKLAWDANTFDLDLAGYEIREMSELPEGATINEGGLVCWCDDPITDERKNEIWDSLSSSKLDDGIITNATYLDSFAEVGVAAYLIKAIDSSGNYSSTPVITGVQIRKADTIATADWYINGEDLVIKWPQPTSDLGVKEYNIRYDNGVDVVDKAEFRRKAWFTGLDIFAITSINSVGNESDEFTIEVEIDTLGRVNNLAHSIIGDAYKLTWLPPERSQTNLPIFEYEIRTDQNWGLEEGLVTVTNSQSFSEKVTWGGSREFYIAAIDTSGSYGEATSLSISINAPSAPLNFASSVVDNNVLLNWNTPSGGTLPVVEYEVRRGNTWALATSIGTKSGKFTSVFETVQGTYRYWIAAIDSAGNVGVPVSLTAKVNQPPDYVLQDDYYSDFSGILNNAFINSNGALTLPVNLVETFEEHFIDNAWSTPQDQINAGYPVYAEPTPAFGSYEEVIDYGTVLASSSLSIIANITTITEPTSLVYSVSHSLDGVTWTTPTVGTEHYLVEFRYVKIQLEVTGGLLEYEQLNIRLDSKARNITGTVLASATDVDGTEVFITSDGLSTGEAEFLDVISIEVTAQFIAGKVPIAVYDFLDAPEPTSFKVYLFDSLTGDRLTGTCSYSVRGY